MEYDQKEKLGKQVRLRRRREKLGDKKRTKKEKKDKKEKRKERERKENI